MKPKVLIVDDDAVVRALLQQELDQLGYPVTVARDGLEGWSLFLADPELRIAIVDWVMPSMDGIELIRRIRAHEASERRVRAYVVMLTSQSGTDQVLKGLRSGADDFIKKGDFQRELRARLEMAEGQLRFEEMLRQNRDA